MDNLENYCSLRPENSRCKQIIEKMKVCDKLRSWSILETYANMEPWENVTTKSRVSIYRTNDPMVTIAAINLKHDQDGRYTHLW